MRTLLISLGLALGLSACATGPTPYGPASNTNSLGYTNQQIEQDRFYVTFTGHTVEEARNYALLRAAQITQAQNYQNFRIIGSRTDGSENRGAAISPAIGIGISGGGRHGIRPSFGVGININDVGHAMSGNKVKVSMEILLENSSPAGATNVYNANSVIQSIRPLP